MQKSRKKTNYADNVGKKDDERIRNKSKGSVTKKNMTNQKKLWNY